MKQIKSLTIVYIITKLELGGAQKVCLALFDHIKQTGITTKLISGSHGTLARSVKENPHVILLDSFKRNAHFGTIINDLKAFFNLIRQLRILKKESKSSPIIVHTHSTKAGLMGRWAAFFAGIKTRVHTVHGYGFNAHQPKFVWWIIYILELFTSFITTHFICVSSVDVKTGIKLFPKFKEKHTIIRAAVDWKQFYIPTRQDHLYENEQEPFIFGTVACFKPQKNIFDLLHAFEHVHQKNKNTHLELIGDGTLRHEIESWVRAHNFSDVITLHGWQEKVAPLMKKWHAFVLSSLWEGLPCAIVEARLLQLPVICYDTGGIRDIIFDQENGLLVSQKDWHELAHCMLKLTQDKLLYAKLKQHKQDLRDFQNSYMTRQHIELYKQLL